MKMPFIARTRAAIAAVSVAGLLAGVSTPVAADSYTGCLTPGGTITRVGLGGPLGGMCPPNHTEISLGGSGGLAEVTYVKRTFEAEGPTFWEASGQAQCPEGTLVTGGGALTSADNVLTDSGPSNNGSAWFAKAVADSTFQLTVWAICTPVEEFTIDDGTEE